MNFCRRMVVSAALLAAACSPDGDDATETQPTTITTATMTVPGTGTDPQPTSTTSSGTGTSDSADSTAGPDTGTQPTDTTAGTTDAIKYDVGVDSTTADTGGTTGDGCQKIDFLFAIDNSGSMYDKQVRLLNAFPAFIDAIRNNVQGQDYHIMVVDSDERPTVGYCEQPGCPPEFCDGYACQSWDTLGLGPCDEALGAGVVEPHGGSASNMDCGFPDDRRYLTNLDADLEAKFTCAAQVGQSGNGSELPITAALTAISDPMQQPGACNQGFLRDDAVLVFTFISDDPPSAAQDDATIGVAQPWYDALVAAKGGNADAVVVVGLMLYEDTTCHPFNVPTQPFIDLVDLFGENGIKGSVCQLDYNASFMQAVATIDQTCDEFIPPG